MGSKNITELLYFNGKDKNRLSSKYLFFAFHRRKNVIQVIFSANYLFNTENKIP